MFCSTLPLYKILEADDKKCCTVVAWSVVFNADVYKSRKYLEYHGRIRKRGMSVKSISNAMKGVKKSKVEYVNVGRIISLKKFCEMYNTGRYYVLVGSHALAVIDGRIFDHSERPLRRVQCAWKISDLEDCYG